MNRHGSIYSDYEYMPSIITRVLNGLYQIGLRKLVDSALRKHTKFESLQDYELSHMSSGIVMETELTILYGLHASLSVYDLVRLSLFFTTVNITYRSRFLDDLDDFDYEHGFKGGTLGDYPIPRIIKSHIWPLLVPEPTSEDELHALEDYLDGRGYLYPQ